MSGSNTSKGRRGSAARPGGTGAGKKVVTAARPTQGGRGTLVAALGVVLVVAVVVGGIVLNSARTSTTNAGPGSAGTAAVTVTDGVVTVGSPDAGVTLDAYEDFLCPVCGQFEGKYGKQIAQAQDAGTLAVRYHALDFLNRDSASGDYSSRAAGAALCVASDGSGASYPAFHAALYSPENQPEEQSGSDLSNEQLAALAGGVGASAEAQQCISAGADVDQAKRASQAGQAELENTGRKVGTPTILNGTTEIDYNNGSWLGDLL